MTCVLEACSSGPLPPTRFRRGEECGESTVGDLPDCQGAGLCPKSKARVRGAARPQQRARRGADAEAAGLPCAQPPPAWRRRRSAESAPDCVPRGRPSSPPLGRRRGAQSKPRRHAPPADAPFSTAALLHRPVPPPPPAFTFLTDWLYSRKWQFWASTKKVKPKTK